ncbi:MAG TPA: porin [Agitococcus sp.]|nr:porin [Pseudomonadales bacterium]MCP5177726.1 porin [Moraxellaceae bacterium]HQV21653.1 porin [Agitococcus sp.]
MKRHLLTLAIAASLLPLAAQAAPRVYGQLNLSIDYMDASVTPTQDGWALNSNSSRVGVKGAEKLNEEYTAVYKLEWAVNGDVGGADLMARERYIGIKHYQWGTMRLGYIDAPFKNAEDEIDIFNDLANLDMDKFIYGQNRLANSINYVSPKFLDVFGANITIQPGEGQTATPSSTNANGNENHLADAYSAAFSYEDDSLYLSYAMDKEVMDTRKAILKPDPMAFTPTEMDAMRFNARYKIGDMIISGMYQMAEPTKKGGADTIDQEDSFIISGAYKMDMITVRGEVLMSTQDMAMGVGSTNKSVDTTLIGVGVDYAMTENTKVFGNVAMGKKEVTAAAGTAKDYDTSYLGFGTEVRF